MGLPSNPDQIDASVLLRDDGTLEVRMPAIDPTAEIHRVELWDESGRHVSVYVPEAQSSRTADEGGEGWQDMATAPRTGMPIQAEIPGHGRDNIIAWQKGVDIDSEGRNQGTWVVLEGEPPENWHDGVCWTVNEDAMPSVQPTRWKMLPAC